MFWRLSPIIRSYNDSSSKIVLFCTNFEPIFHSFPCKTSNIFVLHWIHRNFALYTWKRWYEKRHSIVPNRWKLELKRCLRVFMKGGFYSAIQMNESTKHEKGMKNNVWFLPLDCFNSTTSLLIFFSRMGFAIIPTSTHLGLSPLFLQAGLVRTGRCYRAGFLHRDQTHHWAAEITSQREELRKQQEQKKNVTSITTTRNAR